MFLNSIDLKILRNGVFDTYLGLFSDQQFNEDNDNNHIKTLEEFKKLLRKIDDRLKAPIIENRTGNI